MKKEEEGLYLDLASLIIRYPIIWRSFISNVVDAKLFTVTNDGLIVASINKMNENTKKVYQNVMNIIVKSTLVKEIVANIEFQIFSYTSKALQRLFQKDNWLEVLVYKYCKDNNIICYINVIVLYENLKNDTANVFCLHNDKTLFIKCQKKKNEGNLENYVKIVYLTTNKLDNAICYDYDYDNLCKELQEVFSL